MWLINASSLSLEVFHGDAIPAYAILSHTWDNDEVSFQEFVQASNSKDGRITNKRGYHKIVATCNQALKDGYDYAWVDTCCIDKTSSTELTEAINSMFGWYRKSQVCYAYLCDFALDTTSGLSTKGQFYTEFRQCRWFTRGWCLQELLAPRCLRFFNDNWKEIGAKSSLSRLISGITGIPRAVLDVPPKKDIEEFPVAMRISWIAKRKTTRIEDMSYSLLGILDVNMPMLYGEGARAFLRLQEEIIRRYNDLSIFAWAQPATPSGFMTVLASEPSYFAHSCTDYQSSETGSQLGNRLSTQFSLTNQGVFFPNATLCYQNEVPGFRHHYLLYLPFRGSSFLGNRGGGRWYIILQKIGPGLFVRLNDTPERRGSFQQNRRVGKLLEPICILNNLPGPVTRQIILWERHAVRLRWKPWEKHGRKFWHIQRVYPRASWDLAANQFLLEMSSDRLMYIEFVPGNYESNPDLKYFVLVVRIGDGNKRDSAMVSARIVQAGIWQGLNVTTLGFESRPAQALKTQDMIRVGDSNHISLVGYDISLSVRLVAEPNVLPYHLVYLDWHLTPSPSLASQ